MFLTRSAVDGQEKLKDADAGNTSMTFTFSKLSSDHKVEAHFRSTLSPS